jgi:secreted trypsin-like serine protease
MDVKCLLFSGNFVMTACHCVTSRENVPELVRLSDVNLAQDEATDITIAVASIIRHPSYRVSQKYDDIALIKLARDVEFSSSVYPICLATESSIDPGATLRAVGYGITESGSQ